MGYVKEKGLPSCKPVKSMGEMYLSYKQVDSLLKCINKHSSTEEQRRRDHGMIYFAYKLGLRVGEIGLLKREHFRDLDRDILHIPTLKQAQRIAVRCKCGKKFSLGYRRGGKQYRCPRCDHLNDVPVVKNPARDMVPEVDIQIVEPDVKRYIQDYLDSMPEDQNYLFVSRPDRGGDRPMIIRQITRIFGSYVISCGFSPRYSFHSLRHGRGVDLWEVSKDLQFVKEMLRHRSVSSSLRYLHISPERMVEYGKKLGSRRIGGKHGSKGSSELPRSSKRWEEDV